MDFELTRRSCGNISQACITLEMLHKGYNLYSCPKNIKSVDLIMSRLKLNLRRFCDLIFCLRFRYCKMLGNDGIQMPRDLRTTARQMIHHRTECLAFLPRPHS